MKTKILTLFVIAAVFGLAVAAYALTSASNSGIVKATCCSKSDSCPMKAKGHADKAEHDGKSCPMKKHNAEKVAQAGNHSCCACCGDSCPMKKEGEAMTSVPASEGAETCCDNCDCCRGKHETAA